MRSPYFDLFRRQDGLMPNYYEYVLPKQQLQRTLTQQNVALRRQSAAIQGLGQRMLTVERESSVLPTGVGGVFMDYSHYYPSMGGVSRRR